MHSSIVGQITDVEAVEEQCLDVTIYVLGELTQQNFQVNYDDLTAQQQQTVQDFRTLMISLAPE